ncbi:adenosine monophosphate deaminase, putative [Brugia malayi]|uniref:AMP deaminase n=1 Tax=Brugia malayi TaxID=6279 RepID=A0A1P6BVN1_BRUMA|nr:adenosine monophosphate deaminase, putative [Brugia malayi]CDP92484.1 Bm2591, isoform k [Brugia malayi]VIO88204.1 adenosine monophosphate deaminase, putative [Brugia malayi]
MSSAHRKCPLSGLFGTPPSVNFFSPSTADTNIFLIANNTIIDNNSSNDDSNVDDDSDNIDNVVVDNDDSVAVAATAVTTTIVAEEKATICDQFSEEIVSTQQQQQQSSQDISKLSQTMDGQLTSFLANTLKTVDSDVLDCGPFQVGFMEDSDHHMVSPPFEISQYPIEVKESKDAIHRQLTNRCRNSGKLRRHSLQARMESAQHDGDSSLLQINSLGLLNGMDENLELRARSPQHVEMYTFRDAVDVNYQRMAVTGEELSGVPLEDLKESARELTEALMLRKEYMERIGNQFPLTTKNFLAGYYPKNLPKYRRKNIEMTAQTSYNPPLPPEDHWGLNIPLPKYEKTYILKRNRGMVEILDKDEEVPHQFRHAYISKEKFLRDLERLSVMIVNGPLKSFCYRRLCFLQNKFQLHTLMNELREQHEQKSVPHRDFYNIRKVDTHIHAASSMNQKHLLRFIKKKMKTEKDTVVLERNGMKITLEQVFEGLGISAYDLSVDMLDVHADRNTFHRFDKFNTKYNPVGESTLREIFIKTDNYVGGKYFADVLKEVLSDLEDSKYQHAEPRLSIYGHNKEEWDKLAKWAIENDVYSVNARWLIQIPRLYDVYRSKKMVRNFDEMLDNIFTPLFEVTNNPESHPHLFRFLQQISGIDSVDDESKLEHIKFDRLTPEPKDYCDAENPSYDYYLFYMYANLVALNALRRERGLNTFSLRPHCGEAGHVSHLVTGYLTSESIAHGLLLRKVPVLQYLFYLSQIGIAMSPLSNNSLFISYHRNPLPEFHMKGLNVSLSTDDPLQFHFTKEALMEEYSIAAQVWKLSSCDMCELARNSVLQSGFEDKVKVHWLGPNYKEEGVLGNDISRTNVPDIRVSFRHETLVDELCSLFRTRNIHRIEHYNDDVGGLRI